MGDSSTPFIKKFRIHEAYYLYDVNTNEFFKVDDLVYHLIGQNEAPKKTENILKNYPSQKINDAKKNIESMKAQGYFSRHRPKITYFKGESFLNRLEEALTNKLEKITLVLTEQCNMRCKYCAYSGHYHYHRKHGTKMMRPETMRKGVDFYFAHSNQTKEKQISMYGGEPLTNFDLLKECIRYVEDRYPVDVKYNMTINGTLLDKDKIDWLVKHNFSILISLDGPKKIHDRYRVFKNGKGTFDGIMKNLRLFQSMYPGFYSKKVRFNMVLAPPYDFDAINDFIRTNEMINKGGGLKVATVSQKSNTFDNRFNQVQKNKQRKDFSEFTDSYYQNLLKGKEPNELERLTFAKRFLNIHRRGNHRLPATYPSHGQCTFGERGVFINTDGTFNFCSQVEEVFNLGNVETGYDLAEIKRVYFSLDELYEKHCRDCWAIRFCYKCIKELHKNGIIDEDCFNAACENNRTSIAKNIENYIRIREKNYQAFDYLDEFEVG